MVDIILKTSTIPQSEQIALAIENGYTRLINKELIKTFTDAFRFSFNSPKFGLFLLRTIFHQKKALKMRKRWKKQELNVPAFLIFSVTGSCNLRCKGCYSHAQHRDKEEELSSQRLQEIIQEAKTLGISVILIAGGEPFMRKELLDITKQHPEIIFPIFTNGLLIDDTIILKLKTQKNVVPVISIEGRYEETDLRRGTGVFKKAQEVMETMDKNHIFFGTSITVTSKNYDVVMSPEFVESIIGYGSRLFFYVDYVPIQEGTENLMLSIEQAQQITNISASYKKKYSKLFVAFPGDEEKLGGCLSAGRGFLHISPEGRIEPCPFAPYSDINLKDHSLQEALRSKFLKEIRDNHSQLLETQGGCALWEQQDWVRSLLE
ncbi:GTP 3',8-cyclase [Candidatus Lokiarchaeum ossiferum]|uniref:GTP 3',8-cyclase n=1 Tax=Candidatus Lokiarchaeum ossiferum TaxID=2951803 RepID=A0ABY6HRE2_9ARCH|nr:GTP 3',8-cyclase [Candidatus Lokiarchaeum sp. B-35]